MPLRFLRPLLPVFAAVVGWLTVMGGAVVLAAPAAHRATEAPPERAKASDGIALAFPSGSAARTAQAARSFNPPPLVRSTLRSEDGAINTYVGTYGDCSGQAALTHASAAIDTCVPGVNYFIGHNPGVFTPLIDAHVGTRLDYYDAQGTLHRYRVVSVRPWARDAGVPPPALKNVVAQFQTCITLDGSLDQILDAVQI